MRVFPYDSQLNQPLTPSVVSSSPSTTPTERQASHRKQSQSHFSTSKYNNFSLTPQANETSQDTSIDSQLGTPLLLNDENDLREVIRRDQRPWFGEGSIKSSIFNLTNATLGAGIVSVPFAMMSLGLGLGLLTILLLAIASTTATSALITVLNYTATTNFESIATLVGGRRFSLFVQLILVLFNFGAAIGYLICIGDVFSVIIEAYDVHTVVPHSLHWILMRPVFLVFITLTVLLPLCLADKLSKLRIASLLGLVALELLVIVTFVLLFRKGVHPSLGSFPFTRSFLPMNSKGPFRGIPLLVFAFSCHSNAPSIYSELENQTYRRMAKVSRRSVITALITYTVMGVCGFAIFGYSVAPNVLINFTSDLRQSVLLLIAFIGILIGVVLSYPMNIFPCRSSVELALFADGIVTRTQTIIISIGLVVSSLCIALTIPSLAALFSLTGSTCGAFVAFIGPGMFVLILLPGSLMESRKIKALVLLVVGIVIAILGTAVSILEMFHPPSN